MSSPSPPYRLGNWDLSMIGKSSFEIVAGPLPTTLILACVAGFCEHPEDPREYGGYRDEELLVL